MKLNLISQFDRNYLKPFTTSSDVLQQHKYNFQVFLNRSKYDLNLLIYTQKDNTKPETKIIKTTINNNKYNKPSNRTTPTLFVKRSHFGHINRSSLFLSRVSFTRPSCRWGSHAIMSKSMVH